MGKTEQIGISFRINAQIPAVLHLSDTDLCSILSNSLENAMHACQDIPDEENRTISCRVYIKNGKLCLDIRNTFAKKPVFNNDIPISSHPGHGLGVKSILSIGQLPGNELPGLKRMI
ncbi:MAG: GHKL domain-containing protein [Bulleidia sp.]